MIVVNRFRVAEADADGFEAAAVDALGVLAAQRGYLDGALGRNVDDPGLWLLTTWWRDTGSYRRALSAYDVKLTAVPLLSRAVDEPGAYERRSAAGWSGTRGTTGAAGEGPRG